MIGTQILHYRVEKKLGEGGMGEVFLAENTRLQQQVALKFLPHHFAQDPEFKARFEHEAVAAAALNHPNIVTVHDLHEHEGRPFIVMEYLEGTSLETFIEKGAPGTDDAVGIALQICEGLAEAHGAGIVHRDIKPSNIFVDRRGRVKILDFGLAKSRRATTETKTGTTLGTLRYESPEQVMGKPVDGRSDLFSLGCVLYELITGRTPFSGEFEDAIRYAILNDTPEPLARYKSDVPARLQEVVAKLLHKDPSLRYQTAADLAADLKGLSTVRPVERRSPPIKRIATMAIPLVLLVFAALYLWPRDRGELDDRRIMLAVLPFENLGASEDEYFADGITEEITSRVAGLDSVGVISRTSAMQYKDVRRNIREIGQELGVDYLLEGTVRWDKSGGGSRVRITPQLIRVADDRHIWAHNYERELTEVFRIQADIATSIAQALDVALLEPSRQQLETHPTQNMDAYDLYLRSRDYMDRQNYELAIRMARRAVGLDSSFRLANALLARLCAYQFFRGRDPESTLLADARTAAKRAMAGNSQDPAGFIGMGYYHYYGSRNYDEALEYFNRALELQPNSSDLWAATAYVLRRQGRWVEAAENLQRATRLDPRSRIKSSNLGMMLFDMRRYEACMQECERSMTVWPDFAWSYSQYFYALLSQTGDIEAGRAALERADASVRRRNLAADWEFLYVLLRDFDSAMAARPAADYVETRDSLDFYTLRASIWHSKGDAMRAHAHADTAIEICSAKLNVRPDAANVHSLLGIALAIQGRRSDALMHAERGVELVPLEKDAPQGHLRLMQLAMTCAITGDHDRALSVLEQLMSIPSWVSVEQLRWHPMWDALRGEPRFQALLERENTVF